MDFEWDDEKARLNLAAHNVSFAEATEVFGDELSSTASDPDHSEGERRYLIFGRTGSGRCLVVAFTERGSRIRLISAREMTGRERREYEQ
jgi:uncharacterized protein